MIHCNRKGLQNLLSINFTFTRGYEVWICKFNEVYEINNLCKFMLEFFTF